MFISKNKIAAAKVSSTIQLAIGSFFAFFWIVGIFAVIPEDHAKRKYGSSTESMIAIDLVMLAITAIILFFGIRKKILISKAKKIANIFEGDTDGILPIQPTALLMGMNELKFMILFDKCISKGFIINSSLNNENGVCIVLTREGKHDPELVYIKCPGCGGTTAVRKGYSGSCRFCGSPLENLKG